VKPVEGDALAVYLEELMTSFSAAGIQVDYD
jgi:hypothetical protein